MFLPHRSKPGYSSPGSDRARLILLVVLAAIVFVAFYFFRQQAEEQTLGEDEFESEFAPIVHREVYAKVDPAKLAEVRDSTVAERVVKEMDPFVHLIRQAAKIIPGDMGLLGIETADPEAILQDPGAFRGKAVSIKGNLQWWERESFEDFELFRGYLTTLKGEHVYFSVMGMPDDAALGDVVKLEGFFFKLFSFVLPDQESRVSDALFIVGRRLISSFYEMPPVREIDIGLLESIVDYTLEDSSRDFQEKPLYHLLSYVRNMDDETYRNTQFSEHLAREIMIKASLFRGQPVDVVGHILWLKDRFLGPEGENPLGVKKCYQGLILNHRGGFCYFFAFDLPEWLTLEYKDIFHIKGFFFRNYSYITRQGKPQSAPVVVVRGFEKYAYPEDNTMLYITAFLGGLTVLILGFFFFTVFQDRRRTREYRSRFLEKKKEQLQRVLAGARETPRPAGGADAGASPPAGSDPPPGAPRPPAE